MFNKSKVITFLLFVSSILVFSGDQTMNDGDRALINYSIGVAYSSKGDCEKAIPYFENALELHSDPAIYVELAECYAYGGSSPEAVELLEKSLQLFPDYIKTHEVLGSVYFDIYTRSGVGSVEVAEKALFHLKKACEYDADFNVCAKAIDIAISLKNLGTATRIFEKLDMNAIPDVRMIAFMITIYHELGDKVSLSKLLKEVARRDADNAGMLDELVNIAISNSLYNESLDLMRQLEEMLGDQFNLWDKYMFVALGAADYKKVKEIYSLKFKTNPTSLALYSMANSYAQEHNYRESLKYFKQVIENAEDGWKERIIKDLYKDYMKVLVAAEMEKEALTVSMKYREAYPEDKYSIIDYFYISMLNKPADVTMKLIDVIEKDVGNKELVDDLRKHHKKNRNFLVNRYKGMIYQSLSDYEKSEAFLSKAFFMEPSDIDVGITLAAVYEKQNRKDEVLDVYESLIKYHPENALILNNLGYSLLIYNERIDYALTLTKKAVEMDPENPVYRDSLGFAYYLKDHFDDAEEHLLFAYSKRSDDSEICQHLGDLYFKKGNFEKAEIFWLKAIAYGAENEQSIRQKLEMIYQ